MNLSSSLLLVLFNNEVDCKNFIKAISRSGNYVYGLKSNVAKLLQLSSVSTCSDQSSILVEIRGTFCAFFQANRGLFRMIWNFQLYYTNCSLFFWLFNFSSIRVSPTHLKTQSSCFFLDFFSISTKTVFEK